MRKAINLRIDSQPHVGSGPHIKAEKFRQYTEWLTRRTAGATQTSTSRLQQTSKQFSVSTHVTSLSLEQAEAVSATTSAASTADTFPTVEDLTQYANPEILVTPNTDEFTRAEETKKVKTESIESKLVWSHDKSIPIDDRNFSIQGLTRIDGAHSLQSVAKPKTRVRKALSKPDRELTVENEAPLSKKLQIEAASERTTLDVPSTIVHWEVDDFYWPAMIQSLDQAKTSAAQAMAHVATNILCETEQRFGITGSGRGPGTTTIAMYLARALAKLNKRVLLIDGDLSKPDLTRCLGIPENVNWLNALKGTGNIADSIIRSAETGICVMPLQKMSTRVTWPRFLFDCLGELVDEVRFEFDFVLIDLGPASQIVRELSRPNLLVDATMLVHNVRVPDRSTLSRNRQELDKFGVKRLVVAENFSRI